MKLKFMGTKGDRNSTAYVYIDSRMYDTEYIPRSVAEEIERRFNNFEEMEKRLKGKVGTKGCGASMNRETKIALRIARSKGTVDFFSNADGGSYTLRNLFGTMQSDDVSKEADKLASQFKSDVEKAASQITSNKIVISQVTKEVSGFSQGGYFQIYLSVRNLGKNGWELIQPLRVLGYASKR